MPETAFLFAWYTVGAAGHSEVGDKAVGIGTYANEYSAGGIVFTATLGTPSNNAVVLSNDNGQTFYRVGGSEAEDTTRAISLKYGTCTVAVGAAVDNSGTATFDERIRSLDGNTVTVTISAKLFTLSADTTVNGNKTYYLQDGTSSKWSAVASPEGNPHDSSYFEEVAGAIKLKNASSIAAHTDYAYRAADGDWANEVVSYHTDINVQGDTGLTATTIAAQTFVYGIDGAYVNDVIAAANNYIQIEATVSFAATPSNP